MPVHFPLNVYKSNLHCKGIDEVFLLIHFAKCMNSLEINVYLNALAFNNIMHAKH